MNSTRSCTLLLFSVVLYGQAVSKVWVADNGDGTYKNPVLHADYSDPDPLRVGEDYYLTASSFDQVPGLPILHSRDLVNWTLIGHVYDKQPPFDVFDKVRPGGGAWAPSLRYHNGEFYAMWPDPDFGIYMSKAKRAAGPWSEPLLIKPAKGWIDPCPLWDDDGKAYLVSALAASRAAMKSVVIVSRMSPDATRLLDDGVLVYDGHRTDPTIEGPKFYKRNGYYYIFAPAGGVPSGWQLVLRSKNVYGPYERKVVLAQGSTPINGPHQGGWVDTPGGEYWFLHFQDKGAYGRVVHLQPMRWVADWPVIGVHQDGAGKGEPVLRYKKPNVGRSYPVATPAESDEFDGSRIGPQWQWSANPQSNWAFPSPALGALRLFAVPRPEGSKNLWDVPNLLLQKFPAPAFTATAKVTFHPVSDGDRTGLAIMGMDYAYVALRKQADGVYLTYAMARGADHGEVERESAAVTVMESTVYLRVKVSAGAVCSFSYSTDDTAFTPVGDEFTAKAGRWIGAKVGLFALRPTVVREIGWADYDWFRVE
ncbi:MAG: glycoside hydrolase 43 family protein [Bryobacteraceae bacterium]